MSSVRIGARLLKNKYAWIFKRWVQYCCWVVCAGYGTAALCAEIIEDIVSLPVTVVSGRYGAVAHPITVTVFRDAQKATAPFLVLNHGRAVDEAGRARLGRARFSENAKYFVGLGFAVFIPTRIGYGVTAGPDVEETGICANKNYPPGYAVAMQQTLSVIDYARQQAYVQANRGIVLGQSFGGATAIAVAANNPAGVIGAINFAGGGGGNPVNRPANPCRSDLLQAMFANYGKTSQIPTLWLYSENDKFFGIELPEQWFQAFQNEQKNPANNTFIRLPPLPTNLGDDGHASFSRNPNAWKPTVEKFITDLGLIP